MSTYSPGAVAGIALGVGLMGLLVGLCLTLLLRHHHTARNGSGTTYDCEKAGATHASTDGAGDTARRAAPRRSLKRLSLVSFGHRHTARNTSASASASEEGHPTSPRRARFASALSAAPSPRCASPNFTLVDVASLNSPRLAYRGVGVGAGVKPKFSLTSLQEASVDAAASPKAALGHARRRHTSASSAGATATRWSDQVAAAALSLGPLPMSMSMSMPAPLPLPLPLAVPAAAQLGGRSKSYADDLRAHRTGVSPGRTPGRARALSTAAAPRARPTHAPEPWETPFLPSLPWSRPGSRPPPPTQGDAPAEREPSGTPPSVYDDAPASPASATTLGGGSGEGDTPPPREHTQDTTTGASGGHGVGSGIFLPRPLARAQRDEAGLMRPSLSDSASRHGYDEPECEDGVDVDVDLDVEGEGTICSTAMHTSVDAGCGCVHEYGYVGTAARQRAMDHYALAMYAHANGLEHLPPADTMPLPYPPPAPRLPPTLRLAPGSGDGEDEDEAGVPREAPGQDRVRSARREGAVSRCGTRHRHGPRPRTAPEAAAGAAAAPETHAALDLEVDEYADARSEFASSGGCASEGNGSDRAGEGPRGRLPPQPSESGSEHLEVLLDTPALSARGSTAGGLRAGNALGLYERRASEDVDAGSSSRLGEGVGLGLSFSPSHSLPSASASAGAHPASTSATASATPTPSYASVRMERETASPGVDVDVATAALPTRAPAAAPSAPRPRALARPLTVYPAPYVSSLQAQVHLLAAERPRSVVEAGAGAVAGAHPNRFSLVAGTGRFFTLSAAGAGAWLGAEAATPTSPAFSFGCTTEESITEPLRLLERVGLGISGRGGLL